LEETGEPYRLDIRLVRTGDTASEAYLRINPKGRVPALHIPGQEQILTELPAICWYITRKTPELRPQGDIAEARALEWFNYLSGTLHTVGYGLLWPTQRFSEISDFHPEMQQKARQNVQEGNAYIETNLAGRNWALGESYGMVDPLRSRATRTPTQPRCLINYDELGCELFYSLTAKHFHGGLWQHMKLVFLS
jgi:glutathione S-transferase